MSFVEFGSAFSKVGWECPKCGRCYAPWLAQCASCVPQNTFTSGNISIDTEDWPPPHNFEASKIDEEAINDLIDNLGEDE